MLKKQVTYEDFNGNSVTEYFYFNLTKPELIEYDLEFDGGVNGALQRIIEAEDVKAIIQEFKKLLLLSYGVKSDDGKRFIKSAELREAFEQTNAYSELFMEFATNDKAAAEFVTGILPKDLGAEVEKLSSSPPPAPPAPPAPPQPPIL